VRAVDEAHLRTDGRPRVVITGVGALTPAGGTAAATLEAALAARPAAAPITTWDTNGHAGDLRRPGERRGPRRAGPAP
jgi:3-oxoacyl-(acyl-carrier-protein) synthase